jgi:hypothetical protein
MASLALSLVLPNAAEAQFISPPVLPPPAHYVGPSISAWKTFQPVVETRVRAEPAVTVTSQPRIGYRTAAEIMSVPVTTFRNVTVDEGQYQMVWVPRPVTRQVAETAWQPQLTYRSEPFVYSESVAQWSTRFVPEQTVRYVPQTQVVLGPLPAATVAIAMPVQSPPIAAAAAPGGPSLSAAPIPDPAFTTAMDGAEAPWTTISSRATSRSISSVSLSRETGYEVLPVQALVPGESVKAPSAAIVWQTPGVRRRSR